MSLVRQPCPRPIPPDAAISPYVFNALQPDQIIGTRTLTLTADLLAQWGSIYPSRVRESSDIRLPLGMASMLSARLFLEIVTPRPPGNIHVGQKLIVGKLPSIGDRITATVVCVAKEKRRGRDVAQMLTRVSGSQDQHLFETFSTIFWAK